MVYGWQMALLSAMAGWFVHANLVQIWQYAGITVPVLLLLAAALSATDGRAGVLWPSLRARLRRRQDGQPDPGETQQEGAEHQGADDYRRTPTRSARNKERRGHFLRGRLRPEGLLSEGFRVGLIVLSAAVLILAASAYVLESL